MATSRDFFESDRSSDEEVEVGAILRASHTYATSDKFGATRQFLMLFWVICLVYKKCICEARESSDKRQCLCKVEEFLFSVACRLRAKISLHNG